MKRFNGWVLVLVLFATACGGDALVGGDAGDDASDGAVCSSSEMLCGDTCVDVSSSPTSCGSCGNECGAAEVCSAGVCATECPGDQVACSGGCFDTGTARDHCGTCGNACEDGEVCSGGSCSLSCGGATPTLCGDSCVDTNVDRLHCGACDATCAAGEVCADGACATSCPGTQLVCGDRCADPMTDRAFCGAVDDCTDTNAGVACGDGEVCVDGACATSCPTGQLECGGACIDPATDRAFCGASLDCVGANAGVGCLAGEVCGAGLCAVSCPAGQLECGGRCVEQSTDREFCGATGDCTGADAGVSCGDGEVCVAGACATSCPTGQVDCGGRCVDPSTDPVFCGAAGDCMGADTGATCGAGQVCVAGTCATSCPTGQVECGGRCVDPATDPIFCGAAGDCTGGDAGATCVAGEVCGAGTCATSCPAGQIECAGRCVDPTSDPVYCGASADCMATNAGSTCGAGEVCGAGVCAISCPAGQVECMGRCIDPGSDPTFCGATGDCSGADAGATCSAGQVCAAGSCAIRCPAGQLECAGTCVNTATDPVYCGAVGDCVGMNAGAVCSAGEVCSAGSCAVSCAAGQLDCGGSCVDPSTDRAFCGATGDCAGMNAGSTCGAGEICTAGSCTTTCSMPFTDCTGACRDTSIDPSNCGSCGNVCGAVTEATSVCLGSSCSFVCDAGFADCNVMVGDGCEAHLSSDALNCGVCGNSCGAGTCFSGVCGGPGTDGALDVSSAVEINDVRTNFDGTAAGMDIVLFDETGFAATDLVFLHQTQGTGAGQWEVRRIVSLAGATATLDAALSGTYSTMGMDRAQAVLVPEHSTVTVSSGGTLSAPAWDGSTGGILALAASGAVTVAAGGAIDMASAGFRGVPRQATPNEPGDQGEGQLGVGVLVRAANGNGGGGGERNTGCDCCWGGAGGGGGHAAAGATGSNGGAPCQLGGVGGDAVGSADQATIFFGGAGGQGGADEDGHGSAGANGGGLFYLQADSITVLGAVDVSGEDGAPEFNFSGCGSGGGGAGAGGAIYLDVNSADLGAGLVTANGGAGGNDAANCGTAGGAGSAGRITVVSGAITGSSTPDFFGSSAPVTTGLLSHYNARVTGSMTVAGSSVTGWADLSGNGHDLVPQGTAPVTGAVIGGGSALDFTNAGMRATGVPLAATASITVFAAVQWRVPQQWGAIVHHGSRDGDWSMEQSGFDGMTVAHFQSANDNTGLELTLAASTDYVLAGRIDGTTRYFSSTAGGTTTSSTGTGNGIVPSNLNFYVGVSDANENSNAYIGEVLYYDRALSDAERDQVIAYLEAAWGI